MAEVFLAYDTISTAMLLKDPSIHELISSNRK